MRARVCVHVVRLARIGARRRPHQESHKKRENGAKREKLFRTMSHFFSEARLFFWGRLPDPTAARKKKSAPRRVKRENKKNARTEPNATIFFQTV
jgi:hypothetical protein